MRDTLLFAGCLGFASGILCRSLFLFSWHYVLFVLLVAFLVFGAWYLRRRAFYLVVVCVLLGVVLGAGRTMLASMNLPDVYVPLLDTKQTVVGGVVAEPDIRETMQRIAVDIEYEGVPTTVLAVAPLYPEVTYGETVEVLGTLVRPEPFETNGGRTFRYDQFLSKDGIFMLVEKASLTSVAPPEGVAAKTMGTLLSLKHAFQNGLTAALPEPAASLASGLITGGKQGLGKDLLDAFIVAGLVHIVVLSGYNVMIVAEGVLRSLTFLPKKIAALVAGITIGLFVLAAGAGAASIRAGLMAGLALTARATGRTYAVVRALLIVAVLMLLANPLLLAFDPGFQLSFVATVGLILLSPPITHLLGWIRSAFWKDLLAATLAAQIAVLPLLLYQTGLFSVISLPANLLVLPFVPLAMLLSAIAGFVGMLVPVASVVVGLPAYVLLTGIIETARFAAELPLASFTVPQFPFFVTVLSYVLLGWYIAKAPGVPSASGA